MFVTSVVQFWSKWGLRIFVLGSLAAYAILGLLSGARRRSAYGWRSILRWAVVLILWTAYQATDIAAKGALSRLSLSGCNNISAEEQQLVAFWAPFLLLHLAGPDNMTAYALEDNMLSRRKVVKMILRLLGVMYAIWNYIYRAHSRVLFAAAAIMFVIGSARFVERTWALWRANLDNMEDSSKKPEPGSGDCTEVAVGSVINRSLQRGRELDDGKALLLAQDLFPIWRRALIDSSVRSRSQRTSEKIFLLDWRSMCKVVEMELSLMYEVLYTKASVAHTLPGYLIRFMSPLATTLAASLFWLHRNSEHGQQIGGSFVRITYLLLGAAFAMDVVWLLRALGSTWTYHFLKTKARLQPWAWFVYQVLCTGRWCRLHRAITYLDPLRLVFGIDPVSYRLWSGTIGRYNLLHECTVHRRPWVRWLATKARLEETRYLSKLPEGVKDLLFERVLRILPRTEADNQAPRGDVYTMVEITTFWGQQALRRSKELFGGNGELSIFGREFEQDVLAWHIATCIFLSRGMVKKLPDATGHVVAIEAVSEYLMFLVAERRQMLPGLVLNSLLDETRTVLEKIWGGEHGKGTAIINSVSAAGADNKEKLAALVRRKRADDRGSLSSEGGLLVLDAAEIAGALTKHSVRSQEQVVKMLEFMFNVWVDKLLYAGVRCSRESHARQLGAGGELTTVLWIVTHHAGPFRIGQKKPGYVEELDHKKEPAGEKKAEEHKPEPAAPPASWYPPYYYPPWQYGMPMPSAEDKPEMPKPKPVPMEVIKAEKPIPEGELDPEDAKDYKMQIRFATLY